MTTDRMERPPEAARRLAAFVEAHPRLVVLTGAGCSTESGIPDYRDARGAWKRPPPVELTDFLGSVAARRRYWAGSQLGYPRMRAARPNAAHAWLAELEAAGRVELLITQNVDRLHQRAGSRQVVDLHGSIHRVRCLDCGGTRSRAGLQGTLESDNPQWSGRNAAPAPDGDAGVGPERLDGYRVPDCDACGGMLKPDVVFFGENVPRQRVERSFAALRRADALLVMGSSLKLYSGYRFCREAVRLGLPMVAVNIGQTRADENLAFKLEVPCAALSEALRGHSGHWAA